MSQFCSLAELHENLTPFTARQVMSEPIWCSNDVRHIEILQNACSYIIDPTSTAPAKVFYAERYGGSGIQRNGGGARCGFDGCFQVKGIGANLLVGEGTDSRHSNGSLGTVHAIYEALWGEVLAKLLPYGAVRAQAVLQTNLSISRSDENVGIKSRRALLIREAVVRPAHFERAPYFRPQKEFAARLIHDALRVKSVIRRLPANLPLPTERKNDDKPDQLQSNCIEGLCELARREAWQMAYCRTRFLRLTTSPSNIAMDGRLMDFNGLSCLFPGNYPDDFGQRLRLNELWKEPQILQQGLSDLCLYLGKYLFDAEFTLMARQQVEVNFSKTFHEACYYCYLEQLGIPTEFIPESGIPDRLKEFVNSFLVLVNKHSDKLHSSNHKIGEDSPLQQLMAELFRGNRDSIYSMAESPMQDVYLSEAQRSFSRIIPLLWLTANKRAYKAAYLLKNMENHARKRLQSRKFIGKACMFEEIATVLDRHENKPRLLREAFSDMETRMLNFCSEAFGQLKPIKFFFNS